MGVSDKRDDLSFAGELIRPKLCFELLVAVVGDGSVLDFQRISHIPEKVAAEGVPLVKIAGCLVAMQNKNVLPLVSVLHRLNHLERVGWWGEGEQFVVVVANDLDKPVLVLKVSEETVHRSPSFPNRPKVKSMEFLNIAVQNQSETEFGVVPPNGLCEQIGVSSEIIGSSTVSEVKIAEYDYAGVVRQRLCRRLIEESIELVLDYRISHDP